MRWTNKFGIDPNIACAVMNNPYIQVGDISVTGLLRPPQMAALEQEHFHDMVEDVSDGLWRLMGRAMHHILSTGRDGTDDGTIQEQLLTMEVLGWTVSGHFDILYPTGTLKDYKFSTVWAYIFGRKEWAEQVNLYALMAERNGLEVNDLSISLLCRDWNARLAKDNQDMPRIPFVEIPVTRWPRDYAEKFLAERVRLHQQALAGNAPPCTDDDRWAKPDTWAVQKPNAKRAWRVFPNIYKAKELADKVTGMAVVHRPGSNVRCASYCPVTQFCKQAKALGVVLEEAEGD